MNKAFIKSASIAIVAALTIGLSGCTFTKEFKKGFDEGYNKAQQKDSKTTDTDKKDTTQESVSIKNSKTIKDTNGSIKLDIPNEWTEDNELNPEAVIQVSNRRQEKYVIVIAESSADFTKDTKEDDYAKLVKEVMLGTVKNSKATDFSNLVINGYPAKYFEIRGDVQNLKAVYQIAAVKGKNGFYQVIGWTLNSKYESNKGEINKVIQSFKELK